MTEEGYRFYDPVEEWEEEDNMDNAQKEAAAARKKEEQAPANKGVRRTIIPKDILDRVRETLLSK